MILTPCPGRELHFCLRQHPAYLVGSLQLSFQGPSILFYMRDWVFCLQQHLVYWANSLHYYVRNHINSAMPAIVIKSGPQLTPRVFWNSFPRPPTDWICTASCCFPCWTISCLRAKPLCKDAGEIHPCRKSQIGYLVTHRSSNTANSDVHLRSSEPGRYQAALFVYQPINRDQLRFTSLDRRHCTLSSRFSD